MEVFAQQLVNGIALGGLYALTAVGYSLVYSVLELVNFTHGTMYMVGAYLFLVFADFYKINWVLAFVLAIACTGFLGYLTERFALRPLLRHNMPRYTLLISTIGVSIIIQNVMLLFLGSQTRQYPTLFDGKFVTVFHANVSFIQIFTIAMSLILMVFFSLYISRSKRGMAMRATAQNDHATKLVGINIDRVRGDTFFVGAMLAAVSGILACMMFRSVDLDWLASTGSKTFAATVLGGIGEFRGAVLGGLVIGLVEVFISGYIDSSLRDIGAFVILVVVIIFRPYGLMGKPAQKKV